eukprot:gnl/TRDRNA2_/TRDRNA2_92081_c0_seq1.p1 gnl/TRDRNA2_/TRDRNA2_92081_c0~~gnl/TRDRNA2_/TRDRNA2_92081_c0_seq1.p1  ORF type:complete len:157 (+),score=34.60 gnl/TRDRNA2_/TRDRNA2_92081_c0_seq1:123-593(+)
MGAACGGCFEGPTKVGSQPVAGHVEPSQPTGLSSQEFQKKVEERARLMKDVEAFAQSLKSPGFDVWLLETSTDKRISCTLTIDESLKNLLLEGPEDIGEAQFSLNDVDSINQGPSSLNCVIFNMKNNAPLITLCFQGEAVDKVYNGMNTLLALSQL